MLFSITITILLAGPAFAKDYGVAEQEIELVSEEPIEFDEGKRQMIAAGEATLTYEDLVLQANRIVYHEETGLAEAEGNIRFSQQGYRLLGERLQIDLRSRQLEAEKVRFGSPPIYAEAAKARGGKNRIELIDADVFYREPDKFAPRLKVEKFVMEDGDVIMGEGVRFKALGIPILYLPKARIPRELEPLRISANLGRRGNLGGFFSESGTLSTERPFVCGGECRLLQRAGGAAGTGFGFGSGNGNGRHLGRDISRVYSG